MPNVFPLALVAPLLALASRQAPAPSAPSTEVRPYKLDARVVAEPNLPDLAGKTHALFAESEGKALVLVFWSYKDPVSRFYAKPLAELASARADKLKIVLVDSNHDELVTGGDPLARLREVVAAEKVTLPLLLDHGNALADDFGATANGQVYLLDANRFLRYHGGIDDDPRGERSAQGLARRAWLETAIDEVLAGTRPTEPWTRPSGRPIKRAPKGAAAAGSTVPGKEQPK
jgi:hypothetical protein